MLTIKQIDKIAEDGWDIVLKRGLHPQRYCGWCLPDEKEIRVYLPQLINRDSLALTLFHELIHARDESKRDAARTKRSDVKVEDEAVETYERNPRLADFICELYALDIPGRLR